MIVSLETARQLVTKNKGKLQNVLGLRARKIQCPWHNDKNASLVYFDEPEPKFYCFGCGKVYDVARVYMKLKHGKDINGDPTIYNAYELLLKELTGTEYSVAPDNDDVALALKRAINAAANELLIPIVPDNKASVQAYEFLHNKGIYGLDISSKYHVYVMDPSKHKLRVLERAAEKFHVSRTELEDTFMPVWPGRIVYAILDETGYIVGFAARRLDGQEPKYTNSRTTTVFRKGNILYLENIACVMPSLTDANELIVVEGYNDAIAMHRVGYTNAVALCGIAMTTTQLMRAASWGYKSVTLLLDPDEAGLKATAKILVDVVSKTAMDVKVKLNNSDMDIDELLKNDKFAYEKLPSINPVEFIIAQLRDAEAVLQFLDSYSIEQTEQYVLSTNLDDKFKYRLLYLSLKRKFVRIRTDVLQTAHTLGRLVTRYDTEESDVGAGNSWGK